MKLLFISILLFFATVNKIYSQSKELDNYLDSLICAMNNCDDKKQKVQLLKQITLEHYNVDTTVKYSHQLVNLAREIKEPYYEGFALECLSWAQHCQNDYEGAIKYAYQALVIGDSLNIKDIQARNYFNLATNYAMLQDAMKSDEYYHKALNLFTEINDYNWQGNTLRHIGLNNTENMMFYEAIKVFEKAIEIDKKNKNKNALSEDYMNIGNTFIKEFETSQFLNKKRHNILIAKQYLLKAREVAIEAEYSYSQMQIDYSLNEVLLYEIDNYKVEKPKEILDSCQQFINEAYLFAKRANYDSYRFNIDLSNAKLLIYKGQYNKAKVYADSIETIFMSDKAKYKDYTSELYKVYQLLYLKQKDYPKAYYYKSMLYELSLNNNKMNYAIKATKSMAQQDFEKELRHRKFIQEQREHTQKIILTIIISVLIIVSGLGFYIWYLLNKSKKMNVELDLRNSDLATKSKEIESQREKLWKQNQIILKKNIQITDSINYASFIQRAVLPTDQMLREMFSEYFIIYKPLNIVAGDFYWAYKVGKYKMIVAADSTGHGVPGAFMSMLGVSILNDISQNVLEDPSAGKMLDVMRNKIVTALHQTIEDDSNHDGIDLALIIYDTEQNTINFAGAYRPLIIFRNGEYLKYSGDKMPVGIHQLTDPFTNNVIEVQKGDILCAFSDGIADQYGWNMVKQKSMKFTQKRLIEIMNIVVAEPMEQIKSEIETTIETWRGSMAQMDDWLVVAVKI